MSRFRDAVQRVKTACKNSLKFNNVYDCARPLLMLMGLFGLGGTRICHEDGVYTLRNSRFSLLVFIFVSLIWSARILIRLFVFLFTVEPPLKLLQIITILMYVLTLFLIMSTVGVGCMMTHVSCKRLKTIFQIINDIENQLGQANIRVKHWKITLTVMVLTPITANYSEFLFFIKVMEGRIGAGIIIAISFTLHLLNMWTILFLLIIHERFVGLNKLLEENATLTSIQVVGARNPRDSYMLRRITLARHVHEQLTQVVQLFSDTCRYLVLGLLTAPTLDSIFRLLGILGEVEINLLYVHSIFIQMLRVVIMIGICQTNKAERRVLSARLRNLVAFETDREIVHQVQQYIMYNAYSAPGLIDLQFADFDNTLLLTIIDIIVSNALVIYSYTRHWTAGFDTE